MVRGDDILYFVEDEPPADRPRWYCHEHPTGFDDIDEAVAWALSRARTAIVRTLGGEFYCAGDPPTGGKREVEGTRPWPPSDLDRAEIDRVYERAVESAAKEEEAWLEYVHARDEWLAKIAPDLAGTEPDHSCWIDTPDGASIQFEEFSAGALCSARCPRGGRFGFGDPVDVLAATSGRPASDPWLVAVLAALEREKTWSDGRRQFLELRLGSAELFHVTVASNRASIREHGLDWTQMTEPGIAGSRRPELDAVFLCSSLDDAEFFTWMAVGRGLVDIWEVRLDGFVVENGPDGWWIVNERIPPDRLRLAVSDLVPKPPEPTSSEVAGWGYVRVSRRVDAGA